MNELITAGKLSGSVRAMKAKMKRRYRELCLDGCKTEIDSFFADNYHTVSDACEYLSGYGREACISKNFALADEIISLSDTKIPSADEIIMLIGKMPGDSFSPFDIEHLKYAVTFRLVGKIKDAVFSGSGETVRLISLLADMGALDEERINEAVNPVASALGEDETYLSSDRRTKRAYREKIYLLSKKQGISPPEAARESILRAKNRNIDLSELLIKRRDEKETARLAVFLAVSELFIAAAVSLAAAVKISEPYTALLMFLPVLSAVSSAVRLVLSKTVKHERLLRLDPECEKVKSTKCAVVLSAAVSGAEEAESLYKRLYKLYASNPQKNINICALVDLSPEQVPVTGDDRSVIDSLGEVIDRLNDETDREFSCIVRKRSYSKTQDEYMGAERKRGAILELAKYAASGKSDFYAMLGGCENLLGTRFICAVDLDTEPYMDSVSELLAAALHPYNSPVIEAGRVIKGCGVISPRMVTRLDSSLSSGFSAGMGGIGSVSGYDSEGADFWQDVFGRGSFCGKGLISVEALIRCTAWLPEEKVLSHDILEGELCRTAYAGDIIFTEAFPKSPVSYFKRLDRWIRGDVQNLRFIFSDRFNAVSKLKLSENIFRAALPISVLFALYAGFFIYPEAAGPVALVAITAYLFPGITGLVQTVIYQGIRTRHYYSGLASQAALNLVSLFYSAVMLPTLAVKSFRAAVTALIRMIKNKKLLEWTTSSAADSMAPDPVVWFLFSELAGAALIWSPSRIIRLFGVMFSFMPILLLIGSKPAKSLKASLGYRDTRELSAQTADMWGFFADYVTETENHLPPDNVQFAPVYRICHRTSPTNIGMYMLSVLAACDRKLISVRNMQRRLSLTLDAVERLEKYKGNLYNWYDTKTLEICPNPYVSSVDSGNFICSIVALREGLREYVNLSRDLKAVIKRIDKIISECDLSVFYDDVKGLMAIGINPMTGEKDRSRYDFLMSEARLTSFYAVASRQVPKSHWYRLARTSLSSGFYSGAASYSGTMFEYFMPEILIKSPENSIMNESLKYALWCQRNYAGEAKRPYGISESGYYSFDSSLSYRYMAHGVPKTGLRRGLDSDYVVSPYSTYISLGYSLSAGTENLRRLKKYGMYSRYGFYEALDFSSPESYGEPEIVKSYMSHHVGMSILSCVNVLQDGIFQKRFMRDRDVVGASELLSERVRLDRNVFEDALIKPKPQKQELFSSKAEYFDDISVFEPRAKLLKNGEYTLVLTDGGISQALYHGVSVYSRTRDMLMRPKGLFFGFGDGEAFESFTKLPDMSEEGACEFGDGYASFYKETDRLNVGMKVTLHKSLPCEIRSFVFKNITDKPVKASLFSYMEPSLTSDSAEQAHPAYKKMFLRLDIDPKLNIVTVKRSDSEESVNPYAAIGFAEDILGSVSFDREDVLRRPEGVSGLFKRASGVMKSLISEPDPCVFIRTELEIPPKSETEINLFILAAQSRDELINGANELKRHFSRQERAVSAATAGARLSEKLLLQILFTPDANEERRRALNENTLPLNALWELSVSTDIPLILVKLNDRNDREKLSAYLSAYRRITLSGLKAQLACVFDDGGRYEREHYTALVSAAREKHLESLIYSPGGILPVDLSAIRPELYGLLKAYACHISDDDIISPDISRKSADIIEINGVKPIKQRTDISVALGGFTDGGYVINEKPPLPWCHILSSRQFGTLVSSGSLGFSYAFNSRELRLTPWDNDTSRDNIGERLILKIGGKYYDIISGSAAMFSPYKAEYFFEEKLFSGYVSVGVSEKGMCKKISVKIKCLEEAELAYYCEPCLGFDRSRAHMTVPSEYNGSLILSSAASPISGYAAVKSSEKCRFATDRRKFLSGCWENDVSVCEDSAAAVIVELRGENNIDFYLSYAKNKYAAAAMPEYYAEQTDTRENRLEIATSDKALMILSGGWLRYQALHARIWARTGFYQCSGAYGFRDQLQDAAGIILENPGVCKAQILRACTAQFIEGDVLHWWHSVPGVKMKGIRTRISDDNLWLVYAVAEYIDKTGDRSILDIKVRYCAGITLSESENERYGEVYPTAARETVCDHCRRAIDYRKGRTGRHGLMLIGTGDWNDGFSSLGERGEGESVWLTEFYILCIKRFISVCEAIMPQYCRDLSDLCLRLEKAIEKNGRGDNRYLRAYFDDGTVIGSADAKACKIDSIAQSFAQFAGLEDEQFTKNALSEGYNQLADVKRGVVKLFTPAFNDSFEPNPGYIKNYPEGLRENGGQYTHAAVWLGMACIQAGLSEEGMGILEAINPIARSENGGWQRYKTEPYYLCGDVYSNKNCYSRGGWSIYTGSAAWYYRALTEDILGIRLKDGGLSIRKPLHSVKIKYNGKKIGN